MDCLYKKRCSASDACPANLPKINHITVVFLLILQNFPEQQFHGIFLDDFFWMHPKNLKMFHKYNKKDGRSSNTDIIIQC